MKSFRSTGTSTASRTRTRSSSDPEKRRPSVSTEMAAAPPAAYSPASQAGSPISASAPLLGLERLTSAITETPGPFSTGSGSRAGSMCCTRSLSRCSGICSWRTARSSRTPARMSSRADIVISRSMRAPPHRLQNLGGDESGDDQHDGDGEQDPVLHRYRDTAHDERDHREHAADPGSLRPPVVDVLGLVAVGPGVGVLCHASSFGRGWWWGLIGRSHCVAEAALLHIGSHSGDVTAVLRPAGTERRVDAGIEGPPDVRRVVPA